MALEHRLHAAAPGTLSPRIAAAAAGTPLYPGDAPPAAAEAHLRATRAVILCLDAGAEARPDAKVARDRAADPAKRVAALLLEAPSRVRTALAGGGGAFGAAAAAAAVAAAAAAAGDAGAGPDASLLPHEREILATLLPVACAMLAGAAPKA